MRIEYKKNPCPCTTCNKVYAYVHPDDVAGAHTITLCPRFWQASEDGSQDTKAGTLFHEFTHFSDFYATIDITD